MASKAAEPMTEAEMDAATAPVATAPAPSAKPNGSDTVSQEELDRRWAAGLPSPFDPDDDDLDENMEEVDPSAEKKPDEKEAEAKDDEVEAGDKNDEVEKDEKAEEKAEGEKEPEAEPDPVVAALHERAKAYKLDVTKITDPVVLEASIAAMDRMFADVGEEILAAEEAEAAKSDDTTPAEETAEADHADAEKPKPTKFDDKGKKIEFKLEKLDKLNRDEYAPELIEALDEMRSAIVDSRAEAAAARNALKAEQEKTKSEQARQDAARQEAAAAESTRRIDAYFAAKAKESPVWAELFGSAKGAELLKTDEGKKLFENRKKAVRSGDAYVAGLQSRKLPTGTFDASLDTGVLVAFREKHAEAATKKVTEKVKERRDSSIPRPNSSRSAPAKGGALRATMKEIGMSPDADN